MLVDADEVSVTLAGHQILQAVSLCIHAGEFIGVIGPNGAGKTTLLRCLLGLVAPQSGTISLNTSRVGYVPQRTNMTDITIPMSVLEVVGLGSHGNKQAAITALEQVQLADLAEKQMHQLSGGQQQRVIVAKALAADPEILFLDEPTAAIDDASQRAFYSLLSTLQARGVAIVMVSHDIDVVLKYVSRIVFVHGAIRYDGSPEKLDMESLMPAYYADQHRILHHHGGGHA